MYFSFHSFFITLLFVLDFAYTDASNPNRVSLPETDRITVAGLDILTVISFRASYEALELGSFEWVIYFLIACCACTLLIDWICHKTKWNWFLLLIVAAPILAISAWYFHATAHYTRDAFQALAEKVNPAMSEAYTSRFASSQDSIETIAQKYLLTPEFAFSILVLLYSVFYFIRIYKIGGMVRTN